MSPESVKSIMAAVHLDQVLYDKVVRKSEYTNPQLVVGYLEDFFVFTMYQRLKLMFVPLDNTKLPEQIGKVVITTMLKQTPVDRCRTLITTYPCEYITEQDKRSCMALNHSPCFSKDNPPPGYGYGQWELMDSFEEQISHLRSYGPGGNEPYLIVKEHEPQLKKRKKRSPLKRLPRRRPGKKRGGSSSSSRSSGSRGRPGSPNRNVNRQVHQDTRSRFGCRRWIGSWEDSDWSCQSWSFQCSQPTGYSPHEHSDTYKSWECIGDT